MKETITLTLDQLGILLDEQKDIVIEKLRGQSGYYNKESDDGNYRTMNIDEEKFKQVGREARYPSDYNVLKKYIK